VRGNTYHQNLHNRSGASVKQDVGAFKKPDLFAVATTNAKVATSSGVMAGSLMKKSGMKDEVFSCRKQANQSYDRVLICGSVPLPPPRRRMLNAAADEVVLCWTIPLP
jgi:hypothetical protein